MNITIQEWDIALAGAAAMYGADDGAILHQHSARWTSPQDSTSLTLRPRSHGERYMKPVLQVVCNSSLPADPMIALCRLRAAEETIHRALRALDSLGSPRVWLTDCPCDSCSGRGTVSRHGSKPCDRCGGTGTRNDPDDGGEE